MALVASGVGISPDLSGALSSFGGNPQYNQINANYAQAKKQAENTNAVNGLPPPGPNSYSTQRLNTQQGLDTGNLEASIGAGLGNTAYQNQLAQRDYGQQEAIANQVGAAAAPATLQEIFSGIGAGTKAVGQVAPAVSSLYSSYGNTDPNVGNPDLLNEGQEGAPANSYGYGASGYDPDYGYYYE